MANNYVVITKSGQITIPAHLRKQLRLKAGIAVKVTTEGNRITLENPFWFESPDPQCAEKMRETCEAVATGKIKRIPTPQYLSAMSRRKGNLPWRLVIPKRRKRRTRGTKRKP